MYKIEKGIEIPTARGKRKTEEREMMDSMQVGDSVFIETLKQKIRFDGARQYLKGKVFSVRKVEGGFRCWRIS